MQVRVQGPWWNKHIEVGKLTRSEPSRERKTRLNIHLGVEKHAYIDRKHDGERIHRKHRWDSKTWPREKGYKWTDRIYQI